jgi:hypothetical protein
MLSQPTFSLAEWRDRRAISPGRLGKNLVRDVRAGNRNHLEWLLRSGLPYWDISPVLIRAAHETLELHRSAVLVRGLGVEKGLAAQIQAESETAASEVGGIADRVAALALQDVMNRELERRLITEIERLEQLITAIHVLRECLAQLTLADTDTKTVEGTVAALAFLAESATPLFVTR